MIDEFLINGKISECNNVDDAIFLIKLYDYYINLQNKKNTSKINIIDIKMQFDIISKKYDSMKEENNYIKDRYINLKTYMNYINNPISKENFYKDLTYFEVLYDLPILNNNYVVPLLYDILNIKDKEEDKKCKKK